MFVPFLVLIGTVSLYAGVKGTGNGDLRLRGGGGYYGRVEIYYDGVWGTVCDDSWDLEDAEVVCRQLGLGPAVFALNEAYYGEGEGPIIYDDVACFGNEQRLDQCINGGLYTHNCVHGEDAGVRCSIREEYVRDGSVRLVGSPSENAGRVEIYHDGIWGTVCDDSWNLKDANVVCKQLGYPDGAYSVEGSAYFGEGEGPIFLDDVSCQGTEHNLADCRHNGWLDHNCGHAEDAGIWCNIPEQYQPRLVNGTDRYEGRVEVWDVDHWEAVCLYNFYRDEARTVCKQLGFSDIDEVYYNENFGNGFSLESSIYFSCTFYDTSLSTCGQYLRGTVYCEAAAVRCKHDEPLSGAAIAGIIFAVVILIVLFITCCVVVVCKQTSKTNRRSNPGVAVISGSNNLATVGTTSTRPQPATHRPQTNMNGNAPPSYNEVILNPGYAAYPPVNINTSITQRPFPQGASMHANFTVTSSYQIPPNPALSSISPTTVVHPPPPYVNPNMNQHYNMQSLSHQLPQDEDPAYPPNHDTSSMHAPSMPLPQPFPYNGRAAPASILTPTDNLSMVQATTNREHSSY